MIARNIPNSLLTKEGKVTPLVRGLLVGGFGYAEQSIKETVWEYGPGNFVYDREKPNAITWFKKIYYSKNWSEESDVATWLCYIVHEQRHRHDIYTLGGTRFYFSYLRDYARQKRQFDTQHEAYLNISWEKKAYGDEAVMRSVLISTDFLAQWTMLVNENAGFRAGFELARTYLAEKLYV